MKNKKRLHPAQALGITLSAVSLFAVSNLHAAECADGKTLKSGVLTIATGNPSYYPWVMDNDPASGNGFELSLIHI